MSIFSFKNVVNDFFGLHGELDFFFKLCRRVTLQPLPLLLLLLLPTLLLPLQGKIVSEQFWTASSRGRDFHLDIVTVKILYGPRWPAARRLLQRMAPV